MSTSTPTSRLRHLLHETMAGGDKELGARIRRARRAAGLTQRELAERVGVGTAQTISNYERGATTVESDRLRQISAATAHPIAFFFDEVPEAEQEADLREQLRDVQETVARIERLLRDQDAPRVGEGSNSAH